MPEKNQIDHRPSRRGTRRGKRCGSVAVEFAMVAPLLFLFVFGSIEFGRAFMAVHALEGAALDGARTAIIAGASTTDVETAVANALSGTGITGYTVVVSPSNLSAMNQWDPVTVSLSVSYTNISWLPAPRFMTNVTLEGSSTMPREAEAT